MGSALDLLRSPIFTSQVQALMHTHHVPCLAIAVLEHDAVASAGYGLASIDPPRPCTADTLFNIASASKSLTAASAALLVHDNVHHPQVQYNATISSLLPDDFVMSEEDYTREITLDDVLAHRTGLASHDLSYLGPRAKHPDNARSITRNLRNLEIAFPLRSKHLYCNMMYTVVSYLVERMSGLPFADFLERRFFQPLKMESTNLQPDRARAKGLGDRIATAYFWDEKSKQYQGLQLTDNPEAQGAGSIITSVNDYIKWVKAMANHEGPVTRDVYKGLVKPRIMEDSGDIDGRPFVSPYFYDAGLETSFYRGQTVITHDGSDPGFNTQHFFLPKTKSGAVIFDNSDSGDEIINILMRAVLDELLQVPVPERMAWNQTESQSDDSKQGKTEKDTAAELSKKPCSASTEPRPQLAAYTGTYWNKGYHSLTVQDKNGSLFIDATDRSFPFTLALKHSCNRSRWTASMRFADVPVGEEEEDVEAEFRLHNRVPASMGLKLDSDLPGMIWFDRVEAAG